ncbi:MAG: ribonuclease P protein component [Blastocatellia bacterium]|nr:ribonuclease P protein component [Blastocatellia bacterium]
MNASPLPKKLRNNQQFRRVYQEGQKFHSPYFSAFILATGNGESRCGYTVTRKVGCAVVRNRCKRRLREVVRRYYSKAHAEGRDTTCCDLVLNAKSTLVTAEFKEIEDSFSQVMGRFFRSQNLKKKSNEVREVRMIKNESNEKE